MIIRDDNPNQEISVGGGEEGAIILMSDTGWIFWLIQLLHYEFM